LALTNAGGFRLLFKVLIEGHGVGILPDRVSSPGNGVYAPFFGLDAPTMMLITHVAPKRRAPVAFIYARRLCGGTGYHIPYWLAGAEIYNPPPAGGRGCS
jgi:KDO2-lipid IV(A) lauroyltransferase